MFIFDFVLFQIEKIDEGKVIFPTCNTVQSIDFSKQSFENIFRY